MLMIVRPRLLASRLKDEAINFLYVLLNHLETRMKESLQEMKARVLEMKRKNYESNHDDDEAHQSGLFFHSIRVIMKAPVYFFYKLYVAPLLWLARFFLSILLFVAGGWLIQLRDNRFVKFLVKHVQKKYQKVTEKLISSRLSELFHSCFGTVVEIIILLLWPFPPPPNEFLPTESVSPEEQLAELVDYVELDCDESEFTQYRRSLKAMHHAIPTNRFRATVRLQPRSPRPTTRKLMDSCSTSASAVALTPATVRSVGATGSDMGTDSPASFPPTPFSRAFVMNKNSEKTVSVMFAARDRLRLEAQSVSRDEYSRLAAQEAQSRGQYAMFDPRQSSNGIALSCGNHCAIKVGKGLCSSSRSMIPVRPNAYVYFEFSITVSNAQLPSLGLGLSPPDCPLNVMVGSWPRSLGLFTDGQILAGSNSFPTTLGEKIVPGSTVGMLVYFPAPPSLAAAKTGAGRGVSAVSPPPEITSGKEERVHVASKPATPAVECVFNVNGCRLSIPAAAAETFQDLSHASTSLFPTVSLFSENTRVWCRFCEDDIVYRSREAIHAPPRTRVYCLDGSLLLDESE